MAGRPKKYASAAERQAAYRKGTGGETSVRDVRLKNETWETIERLAETVDMSRNEMMHQLLQFALTNRAWHGAARFTSLLPRRENPERL